MLDRFGKSLCGSMVLLAGAGPAKLLMAVAMADLPELDRWAKLIRQLG